MARGAVNRKLSAKHTDEVIDAFNLFDADKDNRVISSEMLSLIKLLGGQVDCPHIQAMVRACDNNNEGSLGMEEFLEQWKVFKEKVNEEEESEDEIKEAFRQVFKTTKCISYILWLTGSMTRTGTGTSPKRRWLPPSHRWGLSGRN